MIQSTQLILFCLSVLVASWTCADGADEPDTGGLDIEPGLRLRVYSLGPDAAADRPLLPGQSPNVDVTVRDTSVADNAVFSDKQAITEAKSETISNHYLAEWTGWLNIPKTGNYQFILETSAPTRLSVAQQVSKDGALYLDAGWQSIRLSQRVMRADDKALTLKWSGPGLATPTSIGRDQLRAPAFYFRPTQSGIKQLSIGGSRPGLGEKLTSVHPGYRVTNIRPGGMAMPVGGLGMLSDGRLVVARFDAQTLKQPSPTERPNGELWLLSNPGADDPNDVRGEQIADGLFEPSGVRVRDDAIYVSQRSELSKYTFDGTRWNKSVVATGWRTNDFHQISAGLPWVPGPSKDHPGFLFMSRGAGLGKGQNPPNHGSVWKIDLSQPVGNNIEVLTGGHRTPNGLGLNSAGECFVVDNQGGWTPANEINHVQTGKFFGFYQRDHPPIAYPSPNQPETYGTLRGVTPAAIQLPQDEIGNSPTELTLFPDGHIFAGQMAVADMRYGGLNRVFLENVEGVWQGCAMRFTQGLEAGPNRIFFGPDGSLFVGGIGGRHASTWYWINDQDKPTYQGLERLTPTGEHVFEIESMSATADGFVLRFTEPIANAILENPNTYRVQHWTYRPTREYGGPKINLAQLRVDDAIAAKGGMSVELKIRGLKPGFVVHLQTDPVSRRGNAIWSGDVWYTLNQVPPS